MKRIMTSVSARLICGLLFIVLLGVFGSGRNVKADDTSSLEGEWIVQSTWDTYLVGAKCIIVREGDGYRVKLRLQNAVPAEGPHGLYYGTSTQIIRSTILSYDDLVYGFSSHTSAEALSIFRQLAGKVTQNERITLSSDGNSAEVATDGLHISVDDNGNLADYKTTPFERITTMVRVPGPTNGKVELTNNTGSVPVVNTAQVESRGDFYFLTKDGRKLTGEEANKVSLEEGTKIVTGNDGHVKMTLPDNTTFTVGPNSDLVIDKFVYDPDKSPEKIMATMTKGVFRWVTGNKAVYKEPGQMKVNLPVVAVGIRGTDFEATVAPEGSGSVVLNFGQLEITEKKTGFTFIMNAGEKITFGADGSVGRPMKIN